ASVDRPLRPSARPGVSVAPSRPCLADAARGRTSCGALPRTGLLRGAAVCRRHEQRYADASAWPGVSARPTGVCSGGPCRQGKGCTAVSITAASTRSRGCAASSQEPRDGRTALVSPSVLTDPLRSLIERPWRELQLPGHAKGVPTMLSRVERALLYWLARSYTTVNAI